MANYESINSFKRASFGKKLKYTYLKENYPHEIEAERNPDETDFSHKSRINDLRKDAKKHKTRISNSYYKKYYKEDSEELKDEWLK